MSLIEANTGTDEPVTMLPEITTWEALRADHRSHPGEYQELLEMVPPWGQELLVGLRGHHPDSFAHSLRVAATMVLVLEERPFGEVPHEKIILGALLHDVGKEAISLSLLDKDGPLTDGEREGIKPHAVQSFVAIEPHDLLVAQLAGGHHLHQRDPYGHEGARNVPWDTTVGQQLIAAADSIDAKTSARSYKPEWSADRVRTVMLAEKDHSPFLIHRIVDARFSLPSLRVVPRDAAVVSAQKTVFNARA